MPTLRVVVADDNYLLRAGVVAVLDKEPDLAVAGQCGTLDELLSRVAQDPPDVVVTDIRMPPSHLDEGIRAAQAFRRQLPQLGVVVLSHYVDAEYALAVVEEGSAGRAYLLKERVNDRGTLISAVRAVAAGGSVIDPQVVDALIAGNPVTRPRELDRLTPRELEVLAAIAEGRSNAAIAADLSVTDRAVEKHINSIFSKLDLLEPAQVHRRVAAVLMFLSQVPGPRPADRPRGHLRPRTSR